MRKLIKLLFKPSYIVMVRGVDGLSRNTLYVEGRKNLKIVVRMLTKEQKYLNILAIHTVYGTVEPSYVNQPWYIDVKEINRRSIGAHERALLKQSDKKKCEDK